MIPWASVRVIVLVANGEAVDLERCEIRAPFAPLPGGG